MPQTQSQGSSKWSEIETTTHQDHVIKHVIGATVLGWYVAGEAAHMLLDIGFVWTIYLDGEMNLLPQGVAIAELDVDEITEMDRTQLAFDADLLLSEGRQATGLKRFTASSENCLIETVEVCALDSRRRIDIRGELSTVSVETSLEAGDVSIHARAK
jgi:hypothetical protein